MSFISLNLKLAAAAGATLAAYGLYKAVVFVLKPYHSPLNDLPGPPSESYIWGHMEDIRKSQNQELHEKWAGQYGHVMKYKAFFCRNRLFTMDPRALNHVLTHSNEFQKPAQARFNLSRLLGAGILTTEGEKHRQQRRVMNPSFGPSSIRELTPIFFQKAAELRDIWKAEILTEGGPRRIEVLSWLSRATLDVIGLAGFSYRFDSLNVHQQQNELNKAFSLLFHADVGFSLIRILQAFFPIFRMIPTERERNERNAQATMRRIGEELLQEQKNRVLGEKKRVDDEVLKYIENLEGRDLLSVLVKANTDKSIPESQRMSDEDVLAQVPTFLVAGHETTSTQTMWCLFALAQRKDFQQKLREELLSVPTDAPTMDELSALPYLDAVVRETMRVHTAVPSTVRIAMQDEVIPLSRPYTDKHGVTHDSVRIKEGEGVFIPIIAMNRSKEIWGEDAYEFNPERWSNPPEAANAIPGVWGNLLSFLGGVHSCIGYRFALVEMKALLFTLLRTFEFDLAVPVSEIEKRSMVVTRPYLRSEKGSRAQMPLYVTLVSEDDLAS